LWRSRHTLSQLILSDIHYHWYHSSFYQTYIITGITAHSIRHTLSLVSQLILSDIHYHWYHRLATVFVIMSVLIFITVAFIGNNLKGMMSLTYNFQNQSQSGDTDNTSQRILYNTSQGILTIPLRGYCTIPLRGYWQYLSGDTDNTSQGILTISLTEINGKM
jgi:hypothetical protein